MSSNSASTDNASNGDDSEGTDYSTPLSNAQLSPEPQTSTMHDTSRSKYHMKDLASFASNLETSAIRAFPNRERSTARYKTVQVLLLRWKDDDLDVCYEVEDLEKVLQRYGFNTETWLIPTGNSHLKLMIKAASFVEMHESPETLFIVYYGGHAMINPARQSTWSCKRDLKYASLEWSAIQTLFEKASSDVLLLLDCCSAASAAPLGGRAMTETIAACGWESIAAEPGRFSFTDALIRVLEEWINKLFTAAMLHSELLSRLKHEKPEVSGTRRIERRRTPIYIVTTSNLKACSIQFSRMKPEKQCLTKEDEPIIPNQLQQSSHISIAAESDSLTETLPDGKLKTPHVLISLALEEDQILDAEACSEWLAAFPALAKYAKVQSVFKSHSTLLLVSVPVMIWDLLPEDSACSFIGYVCSDNLLFNPSKAVQKLTTLATEQVGPGNQIRPTTDSTWTGKPKRDFETYAKDLFPRIPGLSSSTPWKFAQSAPASPGVNSSLQFDAEDKFFQWQTQVNDYSSIVGIDTPGQLCGASDSGFASTSDYILDTVSDKGISELGFNFTFNTPIPWTQEPIIEVAEEIVPPVKKKPQVKVFKLIPGTKHGVFISPKTPVQLDATEMENALSSYWQNFHPIYPIIHRGTFDPAKDRTLNLAITAIGLQYLHAKSGNGDGRRIHEIHEACREEIDQCDNWTICSMQAIFLWEIFARFRGRKISVRPSNSFNELCNKLDALQINAPEHSVSTTHSKDEVETNLRVGWTSWLLAEMQRRLMSGCFVLDIQQSIYHEQPTTRCTQKLQCLPWLPCPEDIWEASSATIWASRLSEHRALPANRVDDPFLANISSNELQQMPPFSQSILLCSQFSKLPTRHDAKYPNDYISHPMHPVLATLIHEFNFKPKSEAFLFFYHTPLHDLLAIAGDTWVFSQKITPPSAFHASQYRLKTWSISLTGAVATQHACRVLKAELLQQLARSAVRDPKGQNSSLDGCISDYWVLYIATLVCWAFGHRYQAHSYGGSLAASSRSTKLDSSTDVPESSGYVETKAMDYLTAMLDFSVEDLLTPKASVKADSFSVIQVVKQRLETGEGGSSGMLLDAINCLNKIIQGGTGKWF